MIKKISLLTALCSFSLSTNAAVPFYLQQLNASLIQKQFSSYSIIAAQTLIDAHHIAHTRLQQYYLGYPIWGAEAITHTPNSKQQFSLNTLTKHSIATTGLFYTQLEHDLTTPTDVFSDKQKKAVTDKLIKEQRKKLHSRLVPQLIDVKEIVFITQDNKAVWAYDVRMSHDKWSKPHIIVNAHNDDVLMEWNDREQAHYEVGGGFGGNHGTGKISYDFSTAQHTPFYVNRNPKTNRCIMQNGMGKVVNLQQHQKLLEYSCPARDPNHANIFWNGAFDAVNQSYSPANDAMYALTKVYMMYHTWFGKPPIDKYGTIIPITIGLHERTEDAFWLGAPDYMLILGDGGDNFYPLVTLDIIAHEMSHGFTQHYSKLIPQGQSWGISESFSDIAGEAVKYYVRGVNDWQFAREALKVPNQAVRYLDEPTKDCRQQEPGYYCSISHIDDFRQHMNGHFSSGVFNKAMYLLATTPGWDVRRVFNTMVQANLFYWRSTTGFQEAACGIYYAARDYRYNTGAVRAAFMQVGIDTNACTISNGIMQ